jgi:hypothetical protein
MTTRPCICEKHAEFVDVSEPTARYSKPTKVMSVRTGQPETCIQAQAPGQLDQASRITPLIDLAYIGTSLLGRIYFRTVAGHGQRSGELHVLSFDMSWDSTGLTQACSS